MFFPFACVASGALSTSPAGSRTPLSEDDCAPGMAVLRERLVNTS
ncbi:MAG: hypothetical protein AAFY22_08745 [Pseudomonadota bacterium]